MKNTAPAKKKKFNFPLLFALIGLIILFFTVYRIFIYFESVVGMWIYTVAAAALMIVFVIVNRGFTMGKTDEADLPEDWDNEKKQAYLENEAKRRRAAKTIMLFLMPILITLLLDMAELFFVDYFKEYLDLSKYV